MSLIEQISYPLISFISYIIIWNNIASYNNNKNNNINNVNKENKENYDLNNKFKPIDGITFYYFIRSPCARRVWLTLIHKKIKCNFVHVNLLAGEQRHSDYLSVNPQGKVPAIRVYNHPTIPNCCLYESQAIVEWLEDQFNDLPDVIPLYPNINTNMNDYFNVKMWQYWELTLAEEIWPLSRQQVDGVLWRFAYSRENFFKYGPPSQLSEDLFYKHKVTQIYNGTYITNNHAKRSIIRILRGFFMLEKALKQSSNDNLNYLLSDQLTHADIAVYPRLCKMPQNGIIANESDRLLYPFVMKYFNKLRQLETFQHFLKEDMSIWDSGVYPKFVPQWWGKYIPWSLVVLIGNYRSGCYDFKRITQETIDFSTINQLSNESYDAIPKYIVSNQDIILYYHDSQPMSIVIEIILNLLNIKYSKQSIDVILLQHYTFTYIHLMPFSELPVLVVRDRVLYGPHIIIEYLLHIHSLSVSNQSNEYHKYFYILDNYLLIKLSNNPLDRAIDRRWFGWCHTAWHYQLQPLQYHSIYIPYLKYYYKTIDELSDDLFVSINDIEGQELLDNFNKPKTQEELEPYIYEMKQRIDTIELELKSHSNSLYLTGGNQMTYADLFVLTSLCLANQLGVKESPTEHPHVIKWKDNLLSDPVIFDSVNKMILSNVV